LLFYVILAIFSYSVVDVHRARFEMTALIVNSYLFWAFTENFENWERQILLNFNIQNLNEFFWKSRME